MQSVCRNLLNPHISQIHFLASEARAANFHYLAPHCNVTLGQFNRKARFYPATAKFRTALRGGRAWDDRLTAEEAFAWASRTLVGRTAILANFDIYFDHTLGLLRSDRWLSPTRMYFLSRYEEDQRVALGTQCGPQYIGSHDAFVFVPPLPRPLITRCAGLALGMPGMENRMIHEFRRLGMELLNPCKSIRSWHLHRSNVRNGILPLANTEQRSGLVRPNRLLQRPTLDDLSQ